MKVRHQPANSRGTLPCCFTDLSLAATIPPWAALESPREVQRREKSCRHGQAPQWAAQPCPHTDLPSPWGRASTLQDPPIAQLQDGLPLQGDPAAASHEQQFHAVLFILKFIQAHALPAEQTHTLQIRGKRFYYLMDFS